MAGKNRPPDPFVQTVLGRLTPLGEVRARAMFGGHGVYADGLFFALIAKGLLYLKVDDGNRAAFTARGIGPFRPSKDGAYTLSYYPVPPDIFDGPDLIAWAEQAVAAARRARARPMPRTPARRRRPPS
jgi:DNA transformation protein